MSEFAVGCICLIGLLVLFLSGIELAFAMTIAGFAGLAYLRSFDAAISILGRDYYSSFTSYTYTVIPLFVLMGQIVYNSGMAGKLYDAVRKYVGHVSGGLALATVVGAAIFKAISGSTLATAATFASVAVPEMDKYGYNRKLSTGVVASVGTLGWLIPPSGNLIIYAMLTDQSIGRMFLAGVIPGVMMAFFFLFVILGWVKINPSLAQKGPRFNWHERIHGSSVMVWPILIFIAVVGGLLAGFFTPTEAGAAGCITVIILTVSSKGPQFQKVYPVSERILKNGWYDTHNCRQFFRTRPPGRAFENTCDDVGLCSRSPREPLCGPCFDYFCLPLGRVVHRRYGFHDSRNPHFLPYNHKAWV